MVVKYLLFDNQILRFSPKLPILLQHMDVIVLDSEAFEQLKREFKNYVKQAVADVLAEKKSAENSDWVSLSEAQQLLPFKSKTSWQKLRDTGLINFSQFGRKIMYSRTSIKAYLNKNKIDFK